LVPHAGATLDKIRGCVSTSENAWVYTLIREYAHLLIRRPGISDQKSSRSILQSFRGGILDAY
jgi:hypothetical protein